MRLAPAIVWADARLQRLSRGRVTLVGIAGLPSMRLVTTGRRTGLPRETNLLYLPDRDAYIVTGSNWGRPSEPAWAHNLRADPRACVVVGGRATAVQARELTGMDREATWRRLLAFWPGYAMERDEAGRDFPIFVLTPDADRSR
ncbi:nitroreductase [Streptomyces regensis]|uniref:Deazaflavin-dependent oxidoreductase (Nitroreductase family) n=2 Tax=Prauserella rugosa TaxID=43354 RepID=A0A660C775_9PSEU|nr:deazaflavin-dependent oxidoreductase, nitroreductase family [Prauserella sp. Am3]KMS86781.1 nitroreductase [Streptomyces regensis]TWH19196.1 deazaflavin-dependent oxidoreductase (nitroreductase family) [Prauserella rugosa]